LAVVFIFFIAFSGGDPQGVQDVAESLNEPGTVGAMNRFLSISIAIFVMVVVPVVIVAASYNSLVNKEESVLTAWGQVESQFQRRADLVPALVESVTRYMRHERETLTEVTERRGQGLERLSDAVEQLARGVATLAEASNAEDKTLIEDQEALTRLYAGSAAIGKDIKGLLAVVEDYPELASSDQFLELQAQLEGTENRINVARLRFNEAVGAFNSASRRIPGNLAAALGGFRRKAYFRAEAGSEEAKESLFE
jgi:LemA protein